MILGISKIAQSGPCSGLNNIPVYSMEDAEYQPFFGMTEFEVNNLFSDIRVNMTRLKRYYNGYIVPFRTEYGKRVSIHVFNPWSIVNFKSTNRFESFWTNTFSALVLRALFQKQTEIPEVKQLLLGNSIPSIDLQHDMSYSDFRSAGTKEILTFMFYIGFLTFDKTHSSLRIPNKEILEAVSSIYEGKGIFSSCRMLSLLKVRI
jgi:hypothetical protein